MIKQPDCIEIVRPFTDALAHGRAGDVQIIGGVGSAALEHPDVQILTDQKLVIAPNKMRLPQRRNDGSLRDLDCLVKSSQQDRIDDVEALAREVIGDKLEISVFGLHSMGQFTEKKVSPAMSLAKSFVSDRYIDQAPDGTVIQGVKSIFPFAVAIDPDALETWNLQIGDHQPTPIPHPGATIVNYLTRSVSGLRPKDADKVEKLTANIAKKSPDVIDWVVDGPGASQLEFARVLHTLRQPSKDAQAMSVGGAIDIEPHVLDDLMRGEAFIFDVGRPRLLQAMVMATHAKSRFVFWGETKAHENPWLMRTWQEQVVPRIDSILKNKA
ncbi:MAG: hypothetical protein AAB462_02405 [Patescibacteria group bacterium]